jgi:hypothetical protein
MANIHICITNMGWINTNLVYSIPYWLKNFDTKLFLPNGLKPLSYARNYCVEQFLNSEARYLWMLDDDVSPPLDAIAKLLLADVEVIAASVCQLKVDVDGKTKAVPMLLRKESDGLFYLAEGSSIERIDRAGFACVLFHRSVFEKIPSPWFETRSVGEVRGTDFIFCEKMEKYSIPLYGHFGVQCRQLVEVYI